MVENKCQGCPNYKKNEYTGWMQCYGDKCETEIRADERRKFADDLKTFICKVNCGDRRCVDKMDECIWIGYIDEFLEDYEKEKNG